MVTYPTFLMFNILKLRCFELKCVKNVAETGASVWTWIRPQSAQVHCWHSHILWLLALTPCDQQRFEKRFSQGFAWWWTVWAAWIQTAELLPQQTESVLAGSLPLRRTSFSLFSFCFSSFSWVLRMSFSFFLMFDRSLWLDTPSAWREKCRFRAECCYHISITGHKLRTRVELFSTHQLICWVFFITIIY